MDPTRRRGLLERVRAGDASIDDALSELKHLPFTDLGYAVVDHHRGLRQGVPEVILAQSKTPEQVAGIATELARTGQNVLITRLAPDAAAHVTAAVPGLKYSPLARTATLEQAPIPTLPGRVALVSAGTSDMPIAEECAETMRMTGVTFDRVFDVGVAGIHRLLHKRAMFEHAKVVIVVAGMEGALASVVGGLVEAPIVAVPTSVGYGAAFEGLAALLGMLTSCASGITVVNIDNGFGAAFAAARILRAGTHA
jgi:NCAIR mutase (PurE)-related protein